MAGGAKPVKPVPPPTPAVMSEDAVMADIERRHTNAKTMRYVATVVALAVPLLAAYPVTTALAGKDTQLNITIGLTFTVTVTLAGVAALLRGNYHKRRANRLQDRNKQLSRDVRELQRRLKDNGLPDDVTRS